MKISLIVITIVAVAALGLCGYLYWKSGELRNNYYACQLERDTVMKDKEEVDAKLNLAYEQLQKISHTATVLKYALNSFMFAGDLKVLTIGSQEIKKVEEALSELDNNDERMMSEGHWNDFKSTKYFNPLFGLLRGLADSIVQDSSKILPKFQ